METSFEGWLSVDEPDDEAQRTAQLSRARAEVRRNHPRLTDVQVDLIAEVAMQVRSARDKVLDRRRQETERV